MKITISKYDEKGTLIHIHSANMIVGDYIVSKEDLFDVMQLVTEIIKKRIEEPCEFVIVD